jgi:hypothetical protein
MWVIEAQCSWSWRLTITPHINQIRMAGASGAESSDCLSFLCRCGVLRRLTPEQLAAWQPLFDNARKMRDLLARIQDLTLQAVDADDT